MSGTAFRPAPSPRGSSPATLLALVVAVVTWLPAAARAQTPTDLWIPLVEASARVARDEVETVFVEVLGGPSGPHHIVGLAGLADAIDRVGFELPRCFEGLDVCSDEVEAIARGLQADRVIYVRAQPRRGEVLQLTLVDIELGERVALEVRGEDMREAVFAAVSAVTNASAHVTINSEPSGAEVYLDGVLVGATPYESTLGIGSYDLRLTLEGYYDYGSPIELRSGDVRDEAITMERRYAEILVESEAPGAQIVVDGDDVFPANEPFQVLPGERQLEIRAPGYDSTSRTLELVAGEERSYRVTLVESAETIARRKYDTIRARPITVQLGFAGEGFRSTWGNARARLDGSRRRVRCPVDPEFPNTGCLDRTPVGLLGGDIEVLYDWRWLELELFGLGVRRLNLRSNRTTYAVSGDDELLHGDGGRAVVWTLPAAGIRWQYDADWSLFARTGPEVTFARFDARRETNDRTVPVRRTDWWWQLTAGARYHMSARFFGFADLGLSFVIDGDDARARVGGTVGLGIDFGDPFGVQSRLEQREQDRRTAPTEAPEEL